MLAAGGELHAGEDSSAWSLWRCYSPLMTNSRQRGPSILATGPCLACGHSSLIWASCSHLVLSYQLLTDALHQFVLAICSCPLVFHAHAACQLHWWRLAPHVHLLPTAPHECMHVILTLLSEAGLSSCPTATYMSAQAAVFTSCLAACPAWPPPRIALTTCPAACCSV